MTRKNKTKKEHWEKIYQSKDTTTDVSWYQDDPSTSIKLILSTGVNKVGNIIDVGGGDSKLVDKLLQLNYQNLSVLDISGKALKKAKVRLGENANLVTWIESDILEFDTRARFDIWHDRATFHFLTKKSDITDYAETAGKLVKPDGHLIISTFSENGPNQCSGLGITQYAKESIKKVFESDFKLVESFEETHQTPFNTKQSFLWSVFRKSS